ncbi:MAG: aminofutalosine synthase MqnE [Nitrospinae bacterium]|nr:aminofutalosine synthase MqnE [Nitrospinota bacterium]
MTERASWRDEALGPIAEKVAAGERLSAEDGVVLFGTPDLLGLGTLANQVRESLHGNATHFNQNRHINPTNICEAHCRFCAFGRAPGAAGAYLYSIEEIVSKAREAEAAGAREIHIVGGHHPDLSLEWYLEMLEAMKHACPELHLKAFTAMEIDYFTEITGLSALEVIERLMNAGMDSMPGGGAEIFAPRVRKIICRNKGTGERWIEIHRIAHGLGLKSNCTMLYGHVETHEERVDHLLQLRALQDETGGFQAFVPLVFHPENTALRSITKASGVEDLRIIAASRLLLDNIPHIKAYWIMLGIKTAQLALAFGADDLDGTVVEEKIFHDAGADSPQEVPLDELVSLIRAAGREPVERDTVYNVVQRH